MLSPPRWLSLSLASVVLSVGGGCERQPPGVPDPGAAGSEHSPQLRQRDPIEVASFDLAAEAAIRESRCIACHAADDAIVARIGPRPAPSLAGLGGRVHPDWLTGFLGQHGVGDPAAAADLAAYLRAATGDAPLAAAEVSPAELRRGEQLVGEAGCAACHAPASLDGLGAKTDLDRLTTFLLEPGRTRPDLAHDFALDAGEARSIAAWLLRDTLVDAAVAEPLPGLAWECFEMATDGEIPDLEGREPSAAGIRAEIDVAPRTRDSNYALRYRGQLLVDTAGEHEFVVGSDDGSWLWIDGDLVVENGGNKPHRRRSGSARLSAGWHDFLLVFTQAGGGQSLEALWKTPGGELERIPAAVLSGRVDSLAPPAPPATAPGPAAVERGRAAFVGKRCNACHATEGLDDADLAGVPEWTSLAGVDCPTTVVPAEVEVGAALAGPRRAAEELAFAMRADDCLRCHVRDGRGGLSDVARRALVEVADLGDEGVLPPDLTRVGFRLRPDWIRRVLAEGIDARDYVLARCVRLPVDRAARFAALFAAVDVDERAGAVDVEPAFAADAVVRGRELVGSGGKACIACHGAVGRPSIGARGMDLSMQAERLRPAWFREWLLRPNEHRPGTRMPTFWPVVDDAARAEADAIRTWVNLGNAAPLPDGIGDAGGGSLLAVGARPRLHGAFLSGLSAKCLAVGTDLRTHYAYDLRNARLAWLWRGEFLESAGTWNGRAGRLIEPAGEDWVTLPDGPSFTAVDGTAARMAGRRVDADGYPVFVLKAGAATVEDFPRPRFAARGTELLRRVTVRGAPVRLTLPNDGAAVVAYVDDEPVVDHIDLSAESETEVVFRW